MNERERVITIMRQLRLPPSQYVINGSGAMILQGITAEMRGKPMGDLDIFCATRLWMDLYDSGEYGVFTTDPEDPKRRCDPPYLITNLYDLEVNIFSAWRVRHVGDLDVNWYVLNSVVIDGVPTVPLQLILDWKREVGRAKDVRDVALLEGMLGSAAL